MNSVSSRTSLLVCNDHTCDTAKLARAREHRVPIIDEREFLRLLEGTLEGTPKDAVAPAATSRSRTPGGKATPAVTTVGFLRNRRVLVLGGPHEAAALAREQIVAAGGTAAVNLTAQVTDVVLLDNAARDPRWARVQARQLRLIERDALSIEGVPSTSPAEAVATSSSATVQGIVLPRGGVIDLPSGEQWQVAARWPDLADPIDVDIVAFVTDAREQVAGDEDFVFYNTPSHPTGCVDLTLNIRGECLADIRTASLPEHATRVQLAAAVPDTHTFGDVGPVEITLRDPAGAVIARSTLDAATTEVTLILAEIYVRNGVWRFRAVGQGHDHGLATLAVERGVDIED